MPALLDPELHERIHHLWDELATFEAARNEDALMFLLSAVARMIDAQNAYWMGAVRLTDDKRDPLLGWRPRLIRYLHPLPNDRKYTRRRMRSLQRAQTVDEATVAQARLAGTFRACRLRDLVSADWFKSDTYRLGYLGRGVHGSLTVGVPVSPITEAYYGFLRMRENDPFTEAQRDLAFHAMRGLMWFHRQVLLAHGVSAASTPLSPMERRVLALLLTDKSEKLIAAALGVTPSSAHTYVRGVLRKFGVSGRSGLIALWLGRQN
ncbi:MAG TPA: LuxR C-terminal-related transcriptional regulator [Opitutus sp.]|nr:LuxR C-terminal-related transcriptional regulator [Opitutus sp.]